ncbi:hypothetical protein CC80DRAFT_30220 [Byssothecium circinans]|uniref:Branchpoint-bridging protein n=1 Tax=Byssothecium circinans TaxID=147558 RepID=A0A6A5U5X3_9PLEO|nr:hypothetical protein CC80DRAFT_30220 [Byssothecium circinans]
MAWRNQGITGSNNIPLGKRRAFGGDDAEEGGYNPAEPATGMSELKRGRSPTRDTDGPKQRKKRNRWGDASENKAAGLMGLPTAIYAAMTTEQLDAYTLHLRIEEITQKLKINDVVPSDGDRSPSPPPQYDNYGRRVNTREFRYRKRLEDERHKLVEKAMKTLPNYHPPADYRRPTKTQEKVYVPVNDYPEINFIGLLIGPRGNTLKKMESESGAKIAIRGKGSVKEGKGRSDAAHTSNQEEDLHCLIMADTEDKVNKAKKLIHNVIETVRAFSQAVQGHMPMLTINRLPRSLKVRTNSSATSSVSSPLSTVPFATMRTRLARIAVRSAIASTTALRKQTSRPASFVVSAVKLDTWRAIVLSVGVELIGATTIVSVIATRAESLAARTSSTTSSARWVPTVADQLELSSTVVEAMVAMAMSSAKPSLGSVVRPVRPAPLHRGLATTATIASRTTPLPRRGLELEATLTAKLIRAGTAIRVPLPGLLPARMLLMATTMAMIRMPLLVLHLLA